MGFLKVGDYGIATVRRPQDCIVRIETLNGNLCRIRVIFGFSTSTFLSKINFISELTLEKAAKLMRNYRDHSVYDKKELSKCIMELLDKELDVSLWN